MMVSQILLTTVPVLPMLTSWTLRKMVLEMCVTLIVTMMVLTMNQTTVPLHCGKF